jgi:hypothetical protein
MTLLASTLGDKRVITRGLVVILMFLLGGCAAPASRRADSGSNETQDHTFADPQCAKIVGYDDDAMEPFLTRDGQYLLFNSSNAPGKNTELHFARVRDELTFDYLGPLRGANSPVLDGVPTLTADGALFFVSIRSYDATRASVYRGRFLHGTVDGVSLVEGLPREPSIVNFDVEVTADGSALYYARGLFRGGPVPEAADLQVAVRSGETYVRSDAQSAALAAVNTPAALEYAAALSPDERELFFTRLVGTQPAIYRAVRPMKDAAFGPPARIAAITGFVEAPTLSADGQRLYYHQRVGSRFVICRVKRASAGR